MANEIKTEFEMYVKDLAETICKEIYLEDLKNICNTYKEQLDECKSLYTVHTDKDKEVLESAERSMEQLYRLQEAINGKMSDIVGTIQNFDSECRTLCSSILHKYKILTVIYRMNLLQLLPVR